MDLLINLMHLLCLSSKSNVTSNLSGDSTAMDHFADYFPSPYNTLNHIPPLLPLCHLHSLALQFPAGFDKWGAPAKDRRVGWEQWVLFSLRSPCFTAVSENNYVPSELWLLSSVPSSMITTLTGCHHLLLLSLRPGDGNGFPFLSVLMLDHPLFVPLTLPTGLQ